jgi:hypothetical protein
MKSRNLILTFLISLFCVSSYAQNGESGAAIVLNASGLVEAVAPDGKKVPGLVKRGSVLTEGFTISTGAFAESVLLFSNGTVATLNEKTAVRISIFSQEPFEAGNTNFEGMLSEPSTSHLSLSLLNGSLVVKTKKLNDLSIFNIRTNEGVIQVKGTEFQLGSNQSQGIQLDVSESTVIFLPKGNGKPTKVNGGNGLDVGRKGINPRPINPIAAQKISTKNRFATVISGKVPLSTLKQASVKAQAVAGRANESQDEEYEEFYEEEEEEENDAEKALSLIQTSNRISSVFGGTDYLNSINSLLDNTKYAKFFRFSTGTDGSIVIEFFEFGPDDFEDPEDFEKLSPIYQREFTKSEFENLDFSDLKDIFIQYYGTSSTSAEIDAAGAYVFLQEFYQETISYNDLYSALEKGLTLARKILQDNSLIRTTDELFEKVQVGKDLYESFIDPNGYGEQASRIIGLYASAGEGRESILQIAQDIFDIFEGTTNSSSPTAVAFGTADSSDTISLNTDSISKHSRDSNREDRAKLNNEMYKTELTNLSIVPGRDITLGEKGKTTTFDLTDKISASDKSAANRKSFAITATDDLHLNGNITFKNSDPNKGHDVLLLGAANHLEGMQHGTTDNRQVITNDGTHLIMGSYSHLTANYVDITTGGKLSIGALDDLILNHVNLKAGRSNKNDNITLYTDNYLKITNPTFSGSAKEIYMQGTTIDLTDVTFETSKMYLLRSTDGAPNFGSSKPGAVNFMGTNKWGDTVLTKDHFNLLPDSAPVEGYNLNQNTVGTETAGIRIRKIQ